MQKKTASNSYFRNEIDKWIIKEAKLRARYQKAIQKRSGTAAARIAFKIREAGLKQKEIMNDWRFFIYQQEKKEESLCQKIYIQE